MDEANELKTQEDYESISITCESDDLEMMTCDYPKLSYDFKSPPLRIKKASTLPVGIVGNFEEKIGIERYTIESQSSDGSDDFMRSPALPIIKRNHQRSYSESFYRKKRLSSDTSNEGNEGMKNIYTYISTA